MTLSTHVYLLTEADPVDVFMECRRLLGATTETWQDRDVSKYHAAGVWEIGNNIGQGLPALMGVRYRPGAAVQADHEGHDPEWCSEDCTYQHDPAHWIFIDFDTAYSYHDEHGGCGTLHARLLFQLGEWLDARGIQWAWRNEFTGEVHIGDKYERLADLTDGGQAAMRWFKGVVEPALPALVAGLASREIQDGVDR
jgi:hypothetical protein